jgi:hypothetical protein
MLVYEFLSMTKQCEPYILTQHWEQIAKINIFVGHVSASLVTPSKILSTKEETDWPKSWRLGRRARIYCVESPSRKN